MKILILAGAGTSVELGVPAMAGMATEFIAHCQQWQIEPDLVKDLIGRTLDIEYLIESLDQLSSARSPLEAIGGLSGRLQAVDKVRSEVEWFVQHVAERISPADARLMWGGVFRSLERHSIAFVTTNYDRAIELAANAEGVQIDDGFAAFDESEAAPWLGFKRGGRPMLVKLHGSTDWYLNRESDQPLKMRHPMPLFGRATLTLASGVNLGSSLVLPSREKLLTRPPYPRLSQAFLNLVDECDAAIFVGSSLRDSHIKGAAVSIAGTRPVFIVNRTGSLFGVQNALAIKQSASRFLMATLPRSLRQTDAIADLKEACVADDERGGQSLLPVMRTALDERELSERRCAAIEQLDREAVYVEDELVGRLLNSADPIVSRYALGLIATSPYPRQLVKRAQDSPHVSDSEFADELALLVEMIERPSTRLPVSQAA